MSDMIRIERIIVTEVLVPAHPRAINSAGVDQPLHKLPVAGEPAWSKQFDELPKAILELHLNDGMRLNVWHVRPDTKQQETNTKQ